MPSTSPLSALAPEFTPRENGVVENAADDAVVPDLATSDLNMAPDLLARTMTEADMCDIRSVAADQQATDSIPPPSGNGDVCAEIAAISDRSDTSQEKSTPSQTTEAYPYGIAEVNRFNLAGTRRWGKIRCRVTAKQIAVWEIALILRVHVV
eukprot:gene24051-29188_t